MFCPKCGTQADETDVFCRICGNSLRQIPKVESISTTKSTTMKMPKKRLIVVIALALTVFVALGIFIGFSGILGFTENDVLSGRAYSLYYTPLEDYYDTEYGNCCYLIGFRNSTDCFMENIGDGIYGGFDIYEARFRGDGSNVVIPEKLGGMTVIAITGGAFNGCYSVSSIEIPDTVISIDSTPFDGCRKDLNLIGSVGSEADIFSQENCITYNGEDRTNSANSHKIFYVNDNSGVKIIAFQNSQYNTLTQRTKTICEKQGLEIKSIQLLTDGFFMIIPKTIDGKSVYSIGRGAFAHSEFFYSITIPACVQEVEEGAIKSNDGFVMLVSNSEAVISYSEQYGYECWSQRDIADYVTD